MKAQQVEFGGDGLQGRQLFVRVAFAFDQLPANLRGGQAAIQSGTAKLGIGLHVILNDVAPVVEQSRQMKLDRLSPATGRGIADNAGIDFVRGLAKRVPALAELPLGLSVRQIQIPTGPSHEVSALDTMKPASGINKKALNIRSKIHPATLHP